MQLIIEALIKNLNKSRYLLSNLNNDQFSDRSIPPYFSCIGSHIRHILDFFDCILNESNGIVDLSIRRRDVSVEKDIHKAIDYFESIINRLEDLNSELDKDLIVIDDLGLGKIEINYTLSSLLSQANSHTIHHYAIISYIIKGLDITFKDDTFGYNPTTPKLFTS